jgi:hypothetical protein
MTSVFRAGSRIPAPLVIRPIGLDDFSDVRHLHASVFVAEAGEVLSDEVLDGFRGFVYSPEYADLLMAHDVCGGWVDGELVGTAAWQADPETPPKALIGLVFVRHPGFGIGRRLVAEAEARAQLSGFGDLEARMTANGVPFLERLGYEAAGEASLTLAPTCTLPVHTLRKRVRTRTRSAWEGR